MRLPNPSWRSRPDPVYLQAYRALVDLHREGCLAFDLQEVVEELMAFWRAGGVDSDMQTLLELVEEGLYMCRETLAML